MSENNVINSLNVALYQMDTAWLDPIKNLKDIENVCASLPKETHILFLPEMFNTGYVLDPSKINIQIQGETIVFLTQLAARYNLIIGGSIPMHRSGQWTNTFIIVDHTGLTFFYDKTFLFSFAGENNHFKAGNGAKSWLLDGLSVMPLICYDLRFPSLSFTAQVPDLMVYSANWPSARISHWRKLLVARAIENQCYVIGVNRTGTDGNNTVYPGQSMVIDPKGEIILEMADKPEVSTIQLSFENQKGYRQKFQAIRDRKF